MAGWHISADISRPILAFAAAEISAVLSRWIRDPVPVTADCGGEHGITLRVTGIGEPESYTVTVSDAGDRVTIEGADERGVLYGAEDWLRRYAARLNVDFGGDYRGKRFRPFEDPCPPVTMTGAPGVKRRGIWTWGHVIYDYRGFFDNMARQKLNTLTVWNDFPPVNGADVVRYAHDRGIDVVWGFSWGWGAGEIDLTDDRQLDAWEARILNEYDDGYDALGGDGIYFQMATEFDEGPESAAFAAHLVRWVNRISGSLLARHPGLRIEFGLHTTSVRSVLPVLAGVDDRVDIIWEDCGSFPFSYHSERTGDFAETMERVDTMLALRGDREHAGFVCKGVSTLFWPEFKNLTGPALLGEADEARIRRRMDAVRPEIRFEQAGWLQNGDRLADAAKRLTACRGSVTLLCEDGCYERAQWMPVAMFAEAMWDPAASGAELVRRAALRDGTVFA